MCGIFGVMNLGQAAIAGERARKAFEKTASRGPDGKALLRFRAGASEDVTARAGFELAGGEALLGHHRLAIIDIVDQANQPMRNEDGKVWVVFNGEIYNSGALRAELQAKGHRFATATSDTEVIVHGWEEWGRELPRRLSGIFAIAVLDLRRQELTLLRDFPGTKPLYYRIGPDYAAFASTATAVAWLEPTRLADRAAFAHWLNFGYTPTRQSMFSGVSKLEPGTGLTLRLSDGRVEAFSYKPQLRFGSDSFSSERFGEVFSEALREQLHADAPVGFYLSGGVDSSLVAAYARKLFPHRDFTCYSMRFPGAAHDESPYSTAVARKLGFKQVLVDAPELSLASISEFIGAMDEPISDPSFFSTWHLSKAIGRSVKVCVGGDGGDELFSGYERYQVALRALENGRRWPLPARLTRASLGPLLRAGKVGRKILSTLGSPAQVRLALETVGLSKLAPPASQCALLETIDSEAPPTTAALLERMQAYDLGAPLSEDILFKVDRTSMANHFEARVPFLDQRVVRYALSCRLDGNLTKDETKIPLRRLSAELGVAGLLNPRKQGFGLDLAAGHERISEALVQAGGAERVSWLAGASSGVEFSFSRPMSLWAILVLELWLAAQGVDSW